MEFYVLMSLLFSFFFFSSSSVSVYGWSDSMSVFGSSSFAENYKDAKLLERDPNLSLGKKKKQKTLFFCIIPEMQGHKQMRLVQC